MTAEEFNMKVRQPLEEGLARLIAEKGWEEGSYSLNFRQNSAMPNWVEMRLRSDASEEENKEIDAEAEEILGDINKTNDTEFKLDIR